MEVPILNLDGTKAGRVALPPVFSTPVREGLIHKVFVAQRTHVMQSQGRDPRAGEKTSAESWGTGRGKARMARVKGERHPRAGQAAGVASVVHGRIPHPPKSETGLRSRINRKERILATRSAIAATGTRELVVRRGHRLNANTEYPIVLSDEIEGLNRAADLRVTLEKLGLGDELGRIDHGRKTRSGKAALRGRVKRTPTGPLMIVAEDRGIGRAAGGLGGVEWRRAQDLSVMDLAPGGHVGRLAIWSKSSLEHLSRNVARRVELIAA